MTRPMPPAVRVAGELTPAVVASMCTDAAALAALVADQAHAAGDYWAAKAFEATYDEIGDVIA